MLHFLERNSRCFVMAKGLRWLVTIARMSRRLPFISHHRHITSSCGILWDLTAQLDQLPALSRRKLFYQHRRRQIKYLANTTDAKWEKVFFMLSSFSGCDSRWRNGKQRWEAIKKSSFHHKSASAEIFAIPRKKRRKRNLDCPLSRSFDVSQLDCWEHRQTASASRKAKSGKPPVAKNICHAIAKLSIYAKSASASPFHQ